MPGPEDEEDDDDLDEDEEGDDEDDADDDDDEDDGPVDHDELLEEIVDALGESLEGIQDAEITDKVGVITMSDESVWKLTLRKVG